MFDINTQCNGDIYNLLKPYNAAINKELVQKAYRETGINLPANILEEILAWPETVKCTKD
jgi:hypothetical protein